MTLIQATLKIKAMMKWLLNKTIKKVFSLLLNSRKVQDYVHNSKNGVNLN